MKRSADSSFSGGKGKKRCEIFDERKEGGDFECER